jgi:hypothetical protein
MRSHEQDFLEISRQKDIRLLSMEDGQLLEFFRDFSREQFAVAFMQPFDYVLDFFIQWLFVPRVDWEPCDP